MHRQIQKVFHLTINVLMFTSALGSGAFGQSPKPLPANSEAGRYGSDWECKRGFRRQNDSCLEIKLPNHAFLASTTYGKGWQCHYGYAEKGDQCLAVQVPVNAYLDGDSWRCMSGYRQSKVGCDPIKVPENAFLSEITGPHGWECERGYRAAELACVKIVVPDHASMPFSLERSTDASGDATAASRRRETDVCTSSFPQTRISIFPETHGSAIVPIGWSAAGASWNDSHIAPDLRRVLSRLKS